MEYADTFEKNISEIERFRIYKWKDICWKCGKAITKVSYFIMLSGVFRSGFLIGSIEQLDKILQEKYKFVKRVYKYSIGKRIITNICLHCYSLQGQEFFWDKIRQKNLSADKIDFYIPNKLKNKDLPISPNRRKLMEQAGGMRF